MRATRLLLLLHLLLFRHLPTQLATSCVTCFCCWPATLLGWLRVKLRPKLRSIGSRDAVDAAKPTRTRTRTQTRTRIQFRAGSGVGRSASLLLARHTRRYQFVGQLTDDWPRGLPKSEPEALERLQRSEFPFTFRSGVLFVAVRLCFLCRHRRRGLLHAFALSPPACTQKK